MLSPVASVTVKVTVPHADGEKGGGNETVKRLGFSTAVRAGYAVAIAGADERISYGGVPPKIRKSTLPLGQFAAQEPVTVHSGGIVTNSPLPTVDCLMKNVAVRNAPEVISVARIVAICGDAPLSARRTVVARPDSSEMTVTDVEKVV